jgi:hypothetical protein
MYKKVWRRITIEHEKMKSMSRDRSELISKAGSSSSAEPPHARKSLITTFRFTSSRSANLSGQYIAQQ